MSTEEQKYNDFMLEIAIKTVPLCKKYNKLSDNRMHFSFMY